jgi:hypothetical protein
MAGNSHSAQFQRLDKAHKPVAIFGDAGTASTWALTVAGQIHGDGVYSPVQTTTLTLPDSCITTGSMDENNAPPSRSNPIDSGKEVNRPAVNLNSWHDIL